MRRSTKKNHSSFELGLQGLSPAPSQVWGAVRLVPLIRDVPLEDLRLGQRRYQARRSAVAVEGRPDDPDIVYQSYIPYGMIVSFTDDGEPVASVDTQLGRKGPAPRPCKELKSLMLHRMIKRESSHSFRMLPLHTAMDGFLGLCFGGPDIAWDTWSQDALRNGLSYRLETTLSASDLPDFSEAMRLFEIHDNQCGALVFVGDSFASGFVVSHPADYRALHTTMLEDFYGELLYYHGWCNRNVQTWSVQLDESDVDTLDDLARALERGRAQWASFEAAMATGLLGREVNAERCRRAGPYTLYRFATDLTRPGEHHIGEAMRHRDGTVAYLKTYRLSDAQHRRGRLLLTLDENDWELARAARAMGYTQRRLRQALEENGLGRLLRHKSRQWHANRPPDY